MRKHKFNPIPYLFFIIIFALAVISFREDIKEFANSKLDNNFGTNNSVNSENNNDNNDSIFSSSFLDTSNFTKANVKRVIDGDTIVVVIDNVEYKVRLIGVNSPESTTKVEEYGKESSNYTTKMLTGKTVYLQKDVSETDKYGRLLRYVWLQIPNEYSEEEIKENMFNAILVINGYAQAATYPPDVKYSNYFKEFSNAARDNNVGLWKTK